jgi:hypothetical protein
VAAGFQGPCASSTLTTCTFVAKDGRNAFQVTFNSAPAGGNDACAKAKEKLAAAKAKLRSLQQSGAADSAVAKAKKAVKKAKAKKRKKCRK